MEIRSDSATVDFVCPNRRCRKNLLLEIEGKRHKLTVAKEVLPKEGNGFSKIRCPNCNRFVMDIRTEDASLTVQCSDKRCKGLIDIEMSSNRMSVSVAK